MEITKVEPIILEIPLEQPVQTSFGKMTTRTSVIVRVETDTGEFGVGEIWNNFPSWGVYEKVTTLKFGLEPLLIGENPMDIARINEKVYRSTTVLGLQWGALGPIYHCMSGIDVALWDLKGKHLGKPIYELLGGKIREEIEVYASGLGPKYVDELVPKHQEMGVKAFKLKVGMDEKTDLLNLRSMRNMLDSNDRLMIDANQAWTRRDAVYYLQKYKSFDITWIEEPLRCDDLEGMRLIREQTGIPVVGGENLYGRRHARMALEKNALDVIQPDLSKNGGITESKVMVELASSWEVPYAPHYLGGGICLAASIQFMAAIPNSVILEFDANPNAIREKLFSKPITIQNGKVKVSDSPGLGYELDEEFVEFHKKDISFSTKNSKD